MKLFTDWRGYGYCTTCNAHARQPCKWWLGRFPTRGAFRRLLPHQNREWYFQYLDRYARILSDHHGRSVSLTEAHKIETLQQIKFRSKRS